MTCIIITAPHSLCSVSYNSSHHHCDTLSYLASNNLASYRFDGFDTFYFPASEPRPQIDLNRDNSRSTLYRQNISRILKDSCLLIDVHSAPRKTFGPDVDLVVLDNYPGTWYGKLLYNILIEKKISAAYILGANYNDITEEARHNGIPSIILEYSESLEIISIDTINKVIIIWINQMIHR